ncbi:sulfite exporter TauE/SafE family protein [Helicobacter mesocricetorum]|uniref:sulfite exporter TauE/SafE family protein n=1 Tax=Helicobacter mesocricetorum TaxID=87012 RepID=UPI000CF0E8B6|nr:sulfite exporter TauE/SafE family protein [Helicobacter mesocricetorum]
MESWELISLFMVALVGSFGHCIGMCGGIVLAYCSSLSKDLNKIQILGYHLLYNFGRISVYIFLGVVVGFLGSMFALNPYFKGGLFIFAGMLTALAGISLLGKIKFLVFLEHSLQDSQWYQKGFQKLLSVKTPLSLYLLGVLNGLLPCGFVYAFLSSVVGFADAFKGGVIMAVFGIATIIPLLSVGFLANTLLSQARLRKVAMNIAALAIVVFGVLMVQMGVKSFDSTKMEHKMHTPIQIPQEDNHHNH